MEMRERLTNDAAAIEDRVRPEIEAAKERLSDLNDKVVGYITANPGKCLLGALALGYLVGKVARGLGSHEGK